MPFTPAHPAIVLPLLRLRQFSATGLVAGAVSPDFEYFFKASVNGVHGHTLTGILYFDLPVGMLLGLLFHGLVKRNLLSNLPHFMQSRVAELAALDFYQHLKQEWFVVGYSVVLGAATHIFWDSFTHNGAFFVSYFEVYKKVHVPFQGVNYPLFYALQHISTFIGLASVGLYIVKLPAVKSKTTVPNLVYWFFVIGLSGFLFALRFIWLPEHFNLGNAVVTSISAACISLIAAGFFKSLHGTPSQHP